mmetsp:Transcript_32848/g.98911  ORF Transcript_32848/g.98911 Transcript_32848/m.98911 type:complete len:300 (+) Transcript_32848:1015-1914(+)
MMTGVEARGLKDWPKMFEAEYSFAKVSVGVAVCALIMAGGALGEKKNWSRGARAGVVPAVMLLAIVLFYAAKLSIGFSLDDARKHGWVGETPPPLSASGEKAGWRGIPMLAPWQLYFPETGAGAVFANVMRVLPRVLPSWLAMVAVVAFSSSLDVAAIEMELGRPLDYDSELQTVGLGNLASGLLGGFSGSYIFSQTILNMRSGVADRTSGLVVFLLELLLVLACPAPPTAFVPTGAFGGLLLLIAASLVTEWLVHSRHQFSRAEYAVCLFTFCAIHAVGLEAGFAAGVVASFLAFAAT